MANQLGKRYRCTKCGTEVLNTKAGDGAVSCCDQPMEVQEPRQIPSSD
ncbi:desulfoferrodoxin [Chloroflexota bacterium]